MGLPAGKIEERALNKLRRIIDGHPTIQGNFKSMDKEISLDGSVTIFYGDTQQSKAAYDSEIPVQIKGHVDRNQEYMSRDEITYPVDLADLRVYLKGIGAMYFIVFMTPDGADRELFYTALFPVKVKNYLEKAEKKGNREAINIPFKRFEGSALEFYIIMKQFAAEMKMQGFGGGQLVQKAIALKDIADLDRVTMRVVGAENLEEAIERISKGDVCLYGKREGAAIFVPLEWDADILKVLARAVSKAESIEMKAVDIEQI